jgi:hypothetical protein
LSSLRSLSNHAKGGGRDSIKKLSKSILKSLKRLKLILLRQFFRFTRRAMSNSIQSSPLPDTNQSSSQTALSDEKIDKVVKNKKAKKEKFELKTPKGTKDHSPQEMILRNEIFKRITKVFEAHGGQTIDTPVFEVS